jgi:CNT family concentrative nucleoside transporter
MWKSILGYFLFLLASLWLCDSKDIRLNRNWKPVIYGILFQVLVVFALTNLPIFMRGLESAANGVMKLKDATLEGTKFVFGYLGGADLPFAMKEGSSSFIFAFQALPTVIIVGTLSAILTYMKVLPFLAKVIGYVFKVVFKIKDSIGMVAAAKIFIGQLEAPLLIKHKLAFLPKSDIFIILALAFATSSAAVMPIYAGVIEHVCPNAMQHILMSSVVSVISVLIVCSICMPPEKKGIDLIDDEYNDLDSVQYTSFTGAMSKGLSDGIFVWGCILGSLIGMIALITCGNYLLALLPDYGGSPVTLQRIFGIFMYPFAWLMGISSQDLTAVAQILGTKIALNEAIAFFDLAKANISPSSVIKTIYAINNFGNFACIGITVGGMIALAPNQKFITSIAGRAFTAGLLATGLTSTLMSVFFAF